MSGFDLVAEELDLDAHLEGVDLVITGEGFLDEESFAGKVVGGVCAAAAEHAVEVLAIVGEVLEPPPPLPDHLTVVSLTERVGVERAHADPCAAAAEAAVEHCAAASQSSSPRPT